jgi:hypothetical protein
VSGVARRWPKVLPDAVRERDEPPLPDDALLVRGGQFRVAHVLARAEACQRRLGFPGVSVAHAASGRLADLCEMSPRLLDYDECAVTTAGRIRQRFEIAATGAAPHHSIVLPAADLGSVRALRDLFEVGIALPPAQGGR